MRKSLHILLGVPTDLEFGRGVIQGVIRFSATTNWILSHAQLDGHGTLHDGTSEWLQEDRGGVIALIESSRQANFFKSLAIPCVSVSAALNDPELPSVACDDKMIGGIAASHFLERRCAISPTSVFPDARIPKPATAAFANGWPWTASPRSNLMRRLRRSMPMLFRTSANGSTRCPNRSASSQ